MREKNIFRIVTWVLCFAAIIALPCSVFADEDKETVEHEAGIYYTIQKGDTLWGLSQRFSDSPWQWPDLWNENSQIPNPHLIYPGERIRLFRKKDMDTIVKKKAEVVSSEPPQELSKAVVEEEKEEAPFLQYQEIDGVGFIKKVPLKPRGTIFKSKDNKEIISTYDTVYIRQDEGMTPLVPGEKYTIFRIVVPLDKSKSIEDIGTQYLLSGIVKITTKEPKFAVGTIEKSFRDIAIGDQLIPYEPRSPKITYAEGKKGLTGTIFLGEDHQVLMSDTNIVFIDKGSKDGIKVGQVYMVFYQEKEKLSPDSKEEVLLSPVVYGEIVVLHTEETTSTCVVKKCVQSIVPGAIFGTVLD
jgi:LysM repeat protein